MRKLLLLVIPLLLAQIIYGQDSIKTKKRIYRTEIITIHPNTSTRGYLASFSDSSIFIQPNSVYAATGKGVSEIIYTNINTIKFRRPGATGRGILIGSISGFVTGLIIGAVSYEEPKDNVDRAINAAFGVNKGTTALAGGLLGAASGGVVGGVVGALAKKTFIIGGNKDKFQNMKSKMLF